MKMRVTSIKTRRFKPREPLVPFLESALPRLRDGDCVCVTSKIAALSQGRVASLNDRTKDEWIEIESDRDLKTPWCRLTLKNGEWCANAGVDESNAQGKLILLPKDPSRVARRVWRALRARYQLRNLGVIITDTRIYPLRAGVMGVSLAHAGFKGLRSYVGEPDLDGRPFAHTQVNVANALAVAAVLAMGEGGEQTPLAIIRGARLEFTSRPQNPRSLVVRPKDDVYLAAYLEDAR